jgi:hypothetical protein
LKVVAFAIATIEDLYAVARVRVPYRPKGDYEDGIDCRNADDMFKLYWRYTEPKRMSYMSSANYKLPSGISHAEKVLGEMNQRGCNFLVLEKGAKQAAWFKDVVRAPGIANEYVVPVRMLPPGIDRDQMTYLESKAWMLMYAYMRQQKWPMAGLEVWSAVGTGRDVNARVADAARSGETETQFGTKVPRARFPTQEEIRQLEHGELTVDELERQGVRFNREGRRAVWEAQEIGRFEQRGQWAK